jgi:hypothetical protein
LYNEEGVLKNKYKGRGQGKLEENRRRKKYFYVEYKK